MALATFLGLTAVAGLVISLGLLAFCRAPEMRIHPDRDRLGSVGPDDTAWLGSYHRGYWGFELRADGRYSETFNDPEESHHGLLPTEITGSWSRAGATVSLRPDRRGPFREFALGVLDGELVLMSEYTVWRRQP